MAKRVHELAKDLELSSREVISALLALGFVAKSHSSTVEQVIVDKLLVAKEKGTLQQLATGAVAVPARPSRPARGAAERAAAERPLAERKPGEGVPAVAPPPAERAPAVTPAPAASAARIAEPRPTAKAERPARGPAPRGQARGQQQQAAPLAPAAPAAPAVPVEPKPLTVARGITVSELASKMGVTAAAVVKKLFLLGEVYTIAQSLTDDAAELVGTDFGFILTVVDPDEEVEVVEEEAEDEAALRARPPVITVMGHVDHGKTLLLDRIRLTDVVASEHGGITQHIGAYQVHKADRAITFIDTPGHEAFTQMRARGAKVTDIAVLVVAADDGVKPQTVEALNHAKAAGVPIVVAVNKIDKPGSDPTRVRQQLAEHNLSPEEWGGDTPFVDISAKASLNIDGLLEVLLLVADIQELKANPEASARGVVIEAHLDKGRGPVATVLVQRGTLRAGDIIVCGTAIAKVRAMLDDVGAPLKEASPGSPAQVLGFDEVPQAGDEFRQVPDERSARQIAQQRETRRRAAELVRGRRRISLEDVYTTVAEGETLELNIVLKADVQGSLEAVTDALEKMKVEDAIVRVLHRAVGAITENDVTLAEASGAIVLGFNVRPSPPARALAEKEQVDIRTYQIIYKLVEDVEAALKGMLKPIFQEFVTGRAEVRTVFRGSKIGTIAGSFVEEGTITRGGKVRLLRDGVIVVDSTISSLKRFKDDAREVASGFECGISVDNYQDVKEGDTLEVYEIREIART